MLFEKESPVGGHRRSIRQTDTFCLCRAGRLVRHNPVASPQDGAPTKQVSDKHRAVKQVWQLVGDDVQAGQRYSRVERPQSIARRTHQHGPG